MSNKFGILQVIAEYDREREEYISKLQAENDSLRQKYNELLGDVVRGVGVREKTTFQLIMSGALVQPKAG